MQRTAQEWVAQDAPYIRQISKQGNRVKLLGSAAGVFSMLPFPSF
ncbi:hypothetical protein BOO71_0010669 [Deinococcus marmoris]|uniref:Uncharacterized protein n=1 Tax=Deinococcus marmoris TaxID=249408 RepID=A0A1U7NV91_9DEIO|nr:hypothetical protein BOO71_0010669 [Deinococcus marmoris]